MPVTVCWAAKGGSGTTVVTATLALSCPTDSLLVDLDGELPAVLGLSEPAGQGVADWLASDAPPGALDDLAVDVDRTTRLIPRGSATPDRPRRVGGPSSSTGSPRAPRRSSTPAAGPPPAAPAGRRRPHPARHSRLLPRAASRRGRRRAGPTASCWSSSRAQSLRAVRRRTRGRRAGRGRGQPRPGHRPRRRRRPARRPAPPAAVPGTARCGMNERARASESALRRLGSLVHHCRVGRVAQSDGAPVSVAPPRRAARRRAVPRRRGRARRRRRRRARPPPPRRAARQRHGRRTSRARRRRPPRRPRRARRRCSPTRRSTRSSSTPTATSGSSATVTSIAAVTWRPSDLAVVVERILAPLGRRLDRTSRSSTPGSRMARGCAP